MQPNIEPESLYTKEISRYFRTRQWPRGFKCRIVEKKQDITDDPFLQFQVFHDNFKHFDGEDQKQISTVVAELMTKVRSMGVPIYFKVMEGDGREETT